MWKVCQGVEFKPVRGTMPQSVSVKVTDLSAEVPTHMLAVCQASQAKAALAQGAPVRYQFLPAHNIILGAHCANMRVLRRELPLPPQPTEPGTSLTLPVERLTVPHIDSFRPILEYLYTKNAEVFAMSMIPTSTARPADGSQQQTHTVAAWAHRLARTFTYEVLLRHMEYILGTWQNIVFLGIMDDEMWHALQASYFTIRGALLIQTKNGMART